MTTVLADTWHPGSHGWFLLIPLLWILILFACFRIFWWRRSTWRASCQDDRTRGSDPREILAERYARGEITHDDYRERLGNLER